MKRLRIDSALIIGLILSIIVVILLVYEIVKLRTISNGTVIVLCASLTVTIRHAYILYKE